MNKELWHQDRVAIVTGGTAGIGLEIARTLKSRGANVAIGGRRSAEAYDHLAKEEFFVGTLDVCDSASVNHFAASVKSHYGVADLLINSAGVSLHQAVCGHSDEDWDLVIETNLNAVFKVTKASLRGMTKARWGRVINISSVVGSMGNAGQSNYAAAKSGMEGYSRSLASELASRNITVNCIAPGFIATDMTDSLPDEQKEMLLSRVPAGRLGEANEVAALVSFLAGNAAGYITGETIHINGGMYMGCCLLYTSPSPRDA